MDVKYPTACVASEVVMVGVAGKFVPRRLARQLDRLDFSGIRQLLEVAVDGGQAKGRHLALGFGQDLGGKKRAPGRFHDRTYRMALAG